MLPDNRVVINISGTGYCVYIDNTGTLKENSNQKLFETLFFNQDNIANNHQQHQAFTFFSGANILEKGQIDIWVNRKRKKTIPLSEINTNSRLFPIINVGCKMYKNSVSQILLAQQEKGLITKLMLPCTQFLIDELLLHVIHIKTQKTELKLITEISYNNKQLITLKNDTVITGSIIDSEHE